jgi:hypothetical protein
MLDFGFGSRLAGEEIALARVVEQTPVAGDKGEVVQASRGGEDAVGRVAMQIAWQTSGLDKDGSGEFGDAADARLRVARPEFFKGSVEIELVGRGEEAEFPTTER